MTQALLNNLDTQQFFSDPKSGAKDFALVSGSEQNFQTILNEQASAKNELVQGTLGAMNQTTDNDFGKLTNIIKDVMQEAVEESSLELTFVGEIEEIVEEVQAPIEELEADADTDEVGVEEFFGSEGLLGQCLQTELVKEQGVEQIEKAEDIEALADESPVMLKLFGQCLQTEPVKERISEQAELAEKTEGVDVAVNELDLNVVDENIELPLETPEVANQTRIEAKTEGQEKTLEDIVDEEILGELKVESVEADTSGESASSDLMKNQTAEEVGVKAMLHASADFAEFKLEAEPVVSSLNPKPAADVTSGKIIEQITRQMDKIFNGSKLNIVLNPESLGRVSLQIINTKEGLSAQFTVASQEARNLIMKGLDGLKETLVSHGVNVDSVSVKLNESQEAEYNADWTEQEGSRGGNKERGRSKGEEKERQKFEQMMVQQQDENGKV